MSNAPDLSGYVDVAARIAEFRAKYPDGSLQPADLAAPYTIQSVDGDVFVVVIAAAYRTPDDARPGVGCAWEPYPGKTPYTRQSELMNAETSAWGRAIVAVLAADTRRSVASADEVRNRAADRAAPPAPAPADDRADRPGTAQGIAAVISEAGNAGMSRNKLAVAIGAGHEGRKIDELTRGELRELWSHYHELAKATP